MAQHFLLSKAAKTLTIGQVFRMTDGEAEIAFRKLRWPDTDGAPVCPHCGGVEPYDCRRPNGAPRFECRACGKDFSVTSGTLFASHKLPLKAYLAAIAIFCNEVKGKSALAMSRDLGLSYKTAFVLLHKLREAMAAELKGRVVGGEGKIAEVDWRLFRRLREARKPRGQAQGSPLRRQPVRQAQGGHRHPRARRQVAPGRVPHRKAKPSISSAPASPREPSSTPTNPRIGTSCMAASK